MAHYLVIADPDYAPDYEIEHEPTCPKALVWSIEPFESHIEHTCTVAMILAHDGLDSSIAWRHLPAGRYEIETWIEHGGAPWFEPDGGLRLVEETPA
jgi:hypothetical protein